MNSKPKRVLISYSHDSPEHSAHVSRLAKKLGDLGLDCCIDQNEPHPIQGWPIWMEREIEKADHVLLICTEIYADRWNNKGQPGEGKGVLWESVLIRNEIYANAQSNSKFVCVLFSASDKAFIPKILSGFTFYVLDDFELDTDSQFGPLYRYLTGQAGIVPPVKAAKRDVPERQSESEFSQSSLEDVLREYPLGPPVSIGDVPFELYEIFVDAFQGNENGARRFIEKAMAIRAKANKENLPERSFLIRLGSLPNPQIAGLEEFWAIAIDIAR